VSFLSLTDFGNCLLFCFTVPQVLPILLGTVAVGSLSFLLLKLPGSSSNIRLALIYLHITSFIFLIGTISISMTCGMLFINMFLPAVPILLFVGMFATYLLGPRLYLSSLSAREIRDEELTEWLVDFSRTVGTKAPTLYTTDRIEHSAFSIHGKRPGVCISKRILERLSPEEIKAILIHEIAHIRMKTQILKVSLSFLRFLTPFSLVHSFLTELRSEENRADEYVKKIQGTSVHLDSAKNKIARIMLSES